VKGRLLGIIEAKKVTVNPQNVLEQAKRYAKGVFGGPGNWNGYRVPFLYASNGEIIWFFRRSLPKHSVVSLCRRTRMMNLHQFSWSVLKKNVQSKRGKPKEGQQERKKGRADET